MKKLLSLFLILSAVILLPARGYSQWTISGYTCAAAGATLGEPYGISGGTWSTADKWCISGGTMTAGTSTSTSCIANDGTPYISVTWNSGITTGTLSYYSPATASTPVATFTVNIVSPGTITPGTIYAPSGYPDTVSLTCSAPTGGSCGPYTYEWQSATDGTYTNVSAPPGQSFFYVGSFTQTTTYRVAISSPNMGGVLYAAEAVVAVVPSITPGTVSPTSATINYDSTGPTLTATASSGTGTCGGPSNYTYQWEYSTDSAHWSRISGATSMTYSTGHLTTTTWFRQAIGCTIVTEYTNTCKVTVYPQLQTGAISPSNPAINNGTVPATMSLPSLTGGNSIYSYQWYSNASGTYQLVSGASLSTYTPPALTATTGYYVVVTSNGVSVTSAPTTVTVYPQLVSGVVGPTGQNINYNTVPSTLSLSGTTGGSGTYAYQWNSASSSNGTYTPISSATGTSYSPPALTATTYYEVVTTSYGVSVTSLPVAVNVYPLLVAGAIDPSSLTLASGTSPGNLTSQPATGGNGIYGYQWQSSSDGVNFSSISGASGLSFSPGTLTATTWYRMETISNGVTTWSNPTEFTIGTLITNLNYIRTRTLTKPGVIDTVTADGLTSTWDVQQSTTYFDGLGRSIQTVAKQASPLQNDMVSFQVYDPYGRSATQYLPYTSPSNNGTYKTDPFGEQSTFNAAQFPGEQYYYSQTAFEPSPLNRVSEAFSPGNSWVGGDRGVSQQYLVNGTGDSVQNWAISSVPESLPVSAGPYPAGTLYKNITVDEQGHQVVQYSDLQGHVLLKKVQLTASPAPGPSGWLNTYYVYDTLENLRFVIPPVAVQWLQANSWNFAATGGSAEAFKFCFRYEYDYRQRMSIKKVPGAGEAWMVYDVRDRLVMSQDSNLRTQGKWLVNEYDTQNRHDSTGLLTDSHNQAYWQGQALNSSYCPIVAYYPYRLVNVTFYDNYSWVYTGNGVLSSTMNTSYSSNSSYFITGYNTSPTYAQPITYFPITRGQVTGTEAYIIEATNGQYMTNVNFFDDRGRVIQSENVNISNGMSLTTTQYDFSGKLLRNLLLHTKNGLPAGQHHTIVTKYSYDPAFRLKSIFKNIDAAAADQLIDSMQYNELGQLRAKYLGNKVDSLVYAYNIRGWLTGINPNYIAGSATNYFGMEIGYDKSTSVAPGNSYTTQQFNGNIEGMVWKTAGSGVNRKYDFTYDNVNRLTSGYFTQYNGSGFDQSANINFSVRNLSYDANGNIMTMSQLGYKVGGSSLIDSLTYSYTLSGTPGNQLAGVADAVNSDSTLLGDFHFNPATKQSTDYSYDGNGNLLSDNNKAIDYIKYNYLSLPDTVHMMTKGTIVYTYDANGTRWKKTITDSLARHSTTISYIDGFVYQQNDSINNPDGGADTLQFMSHEEGRARWAFQKFTTGTTGYSFQYDFFEKDHLGNTRMVLTQEHDTTNYLASMEAAYRSTESQLFGNIASTCVAWTSVPNYQNIPSGTRDAITNPNDSVSKVDYTGSGGQTTGPSLLLKVMSGDTVTLGVQSYYNSNTVTTNNSSFTSVLNSLASGLLGTPTGAAEGGLSGYTSSTGPVYGAITSFLSTNDPAPPTGYPKAYLNWILLDDQFNYVSSSSGSVQAASSTYPAGQLNSVAPGGPVVMPRNGYLYIWVSNETQGWDVFFDNLSVQYKQGPVLEENHYYPFGLTMAGISDKALKANYAENKYRFNKGSELQNKEFSDGSGLEMYETKLRELDPQLGRWWQIDSKPDEGQSPYASMGNNPFLKNDPLGDVDGDYYNEKGEHIGNDGKNDNKVYVIRTTQTTTEMYGKDNYDQKGSSKPITQEAAAQTEAKIKDGNFDASVTKNIVQVKPEQNMEKMVQAVSKDDGTGGTKPSNNREYSGTFTNTGVKENAPGAVNSPSKGTPAVSEAQAIDYHSHPSGTVKVPGGTAEWVQPPSRQDIQSAKGTEYVVGMRDNTIYIYNKSGTVATIPLSTFKP